MFKQTVVGLSLAILVVALMAGWRLHVKLAAPAHIQAVAAELASVGKLLSTIPMTPNTAGNSVLFGQSTEQGVGIFLFDIADGQKRLIHEQPRKNYDPVRFRVLGWSPDDSLFAYQQYQPQDHLYSQIVICKGNSGEMTNSIPIHEMMSGFVWLSPHAIAYITINGGKRNLNVVEEKEGGKWVSYKTFKNIAQKTTSMLTATSTHSVAWQEGNTLQSLDVDSGLKNQTFQATNSGLETFSFSEDDGLFLMLCRSKNADNFFSFQPDERDLWGSSHAGSLTNLGMIHSQPNTVEKASWINHKKGVACLIQDLGQRSLFIKMTFSAEPVPLLARGSVVGFAMSHNQIFVAGSLTNEPPGIWQFDSSSGTLICLYSCQEHPFKYTKYVVPVCRTATNAAGKEITYHLWEPVRSSNAKKFPLLIGRSLYSWEAYPEVVANGGDFFVNVDRPAYSSGNLNPWDEDVMTVYNAVLKDSNIDTNAVFLYGFSSENEGLVTLVAKKPDLWKGAILFNPVILPDLSGLHLSKILIDDGIDDASTIDRVIKYQQAAAEAGVPVTLALHKDAGHIYWSNSTKREQAQQLAEFLFGH